MEGGREGKIEKRGRETWNSAKGKKKEREGE